jgi:Flp pilus assembly protein TadB
MTIIRLVSALLMSVGVVILLGLTPEQVANDVLKIVYKEQSLQYKVRIAGGKKKPSKIRAMLIEIQNALKSTHSENKFTLFCVVSILDIIAGCFFAVLVRNPVYLPVFTLTGVIVPYAYIRGIVGSYHKKVAAELETALSIITTSYIADSDIIHAVESSVDYIHEPVKSVFKEFLGKTNLISSNVKLAILQMKESLNNEIFREWCDSLIECQDNANLKLTLQPIALRLADLRIVNAEPETMLQQPRSEFFGMIALVLGNVPLLFVIKKEWCMVLFTTFAGQTALGIAILVCLICGMLCYKYTQPIEFKR